MFRITCRHFSRIFLVTPDNEMLVAKVKATWKYFRQINETKEDILYTRATAACSLLVLSLDTYYVLLLSPLSQTHPILGHTYLVLANLGGHTYLVLAKLGGEGQNTEHGTEPDTRLI